MPPRFAAFIRSFPFAVAVLLAASGLSAAKEPANLKEALVAAPWSWEEARESKNPWKEIRFEANGAMTAWNGPAKVFTGKWVAQKDGTVMIPNGEQVGFVLAFGKDFTSYVAAAPGKDRKITGRSLLNGNARQGAGIVLKEVNALDQAVGGKGAVMADLGFLLANYGRAENDLAAHPEVTVYKGPAMDPALPECRISYLMPRLEAEKLLFKRTGMRTNRDALAPGFPNGLEIHAYDVRFLIYNRLFLLTDAADQVVSLQLKSERTYAPAPQPLWVHIQRDFSTFDYMNTETRAQGGVVIDTQVHDLRKTDKFIAVNMAVQRIGETTTWYVPAPLIRLILFNLEQKAKK